MRTAVLVKAFFNFKWAFLVRPTNSGKVVKAFIWNNFYITELEWWPPVSDSKGHNQGGHSNFDSDVSMGLLYQIFRLFHDMLGVTDNRSTERIYATFFTVTVWTFLRAFYSKHWTHILGERCNTFKVLKSLTVKVRAAHYIIKALFKLFSFNIYLQHPNLLFVIVFHLHRHE